MEVNWDASRVDTRILNALQKQFSFKRMTAVQAATIPLFSKNKDVIVEAVTGSGKTLAFLLPILQIVLKKSDSLLKAERRVLGKYEVQAVIISPTRELASQTFDVLQKLLSTEELSVFSSLLFIGGNNPKFDLEKFHETGGHIIVSTPGRLLDLLQRFPEFSNEVRKNLEVLILDEADILLEMGFEKSLNEIFTYFPKQRRTGLFSATQTKQLTQLIRAGLRNPVKIEIKEKNVDESNDGSSMQHLSEEGLRSVISTGLQMSPYLVNNYVVFDSSSDKIPFIINFLSSNSNAKCLLFFATCAEVDYFYKSIEKFSNSSLTSIFKLHRKLGNKRQRTFDQFKSCEKGSIMLCTDVMSRGVDIPVVDWVIHYDLPNTLQSYIHRSGRSGHQVGQKGNSLLLCISHETKFVDLCTDKGIQLTPLESDKSALKALSEKMTKWMKNEARKSSKFYECGMKAFVSFIRTYNSKNIMSETLFKELDVIDLANSYGLIKIPHMPELRGKLKSCPSTFSGREKDKEIAVKHKNEMQEKRKSVTEIANEKLAAKRKLKVKRQRINKKIKSSKLKGKQKKQFADYLEMKELAEDAKVVKKLKKGKISEAQFDDHFGI